MIILLIQMQLEVKVEYDLTYRLNTHVFAIVSKGFAAGENLVINPTVILNC
jgi:hypothetical protein